jgi:hypothetical protein
MAALKLALADVILPDETDEIFANEAGRMSCGCSDGLSQGLGKPSPQHGVTARTSRLRSWIRFAERDFSDRPESMTPPPGSQLTGLGGAPSVNRTWPQFINHPKRSDSLARNRIIHE